MKKLLLIAALVGLISSQASALTFVKVVQANTYTNLLSGSWALTQVILNSSVGATSGILIDSPTNGALSYTNLPYTNITSYATNYNITWTNYYGVVQTNYAPIEALIDVTNSVAQTTNLYPQRMTIGINTNGTTTYQGVNYYFSSGISYTNNGPNAVSITLTVH